MYVERRRLSVCIVRIICVSVRQCQFSFIFLSVAFSQNVSFNERGMGYCMWAIKRQHCSWTGVFLVVSYWRNTGITTSNACHGAVDGKDGG